MNSITFYPKNISLKGSSLISGFHGIGATGYWSVKYLIQKLSLQRCCIVDYSYGAPVSTLNGGKISTPYEIYKNETLSLFKVDVPLQKEQEVEFYREFAHNIIRKGVKEVFLIGGLDSSLKNDNSLFRVAATSSYNLRGILKEAKPLEDDHIIVGPVAILLNYFEIMKFPAVAVLVYASSDRIDPRAAATAVQVTSDYYGFKVDVSPLIKGAETIEAELLKESTQTEYKPNTNIYT